MEPGWLHEAVAGVLLELLRELAAKNNVHLNVGKTDLPDNPVTVIADDEGPQPIEVTSRLIAHAARRIPGIKKLEKMAEGRDIKAGPMSDLGTLFAQLYARNKSQIDLAASGAVMEKVFHKQPSKPDGVIVDFGVVRPPEGNNNNGGNDNA